jgi:hypothetical protein
MHHYRCYGLCHGISPQTIIIALRQLLKDMKPTILGDVDIDMLEVWKCTALASDDDDPEVLQEIILRLDLSNKKTARILGPARNVSSLGVQGDERLLTGGNLLIIVMPAAIRECKKEHRDIFNQVILVTTMQIL